MAGILTCLSLIFISNSLTAQGNIVILGNSSWEPIISATDIIEAGEDLPGQIESAADITKISVSKPGSTSNPFTWKVDIHRIDSDWSPQLSLYARRTGDGNTLGTIAGGLNYVLIGEFASNFFYGIKNSSQIPIQYRLSGVTVAIPAKTYTTTIVYTLTEY